MLRDKYNGRGYKHLSTHAQYGRLKRRGSGAARSADVHVICQLRNSFEKMAGEEDVELRDLVAQSLEAKGVLGKIRVSLTLRVSRISAETPTLKAYVERLRVRVCVETFRQPSAPRIRPVFMACPLR